MPVPAAETPRLPSLSEAEWLSWPATKAVFAALADGGYAARAVGGAVRDTLFGRPVREIDIATTAPPEQVMALATRAGLKAIPTGVDHGTVTVVADGRTFEVTTLRRDVETFGRLAKVAFTDDWAEDARRRDFTVNALYAGADGTLHDPLGGATDVAARRVRFIGDPQERIREDYLRILRFFRFNAEFGAPPYDMAGLVACVRERHGLARLSAERVRVELMRLLAAPGAVCAVQAMFDHGLLVEVLAAVPYLAFFARLAAVEDALARAPDPVLRLAALAVAVPEDADRLRGRLRLSNAEHERLGAAARPAPTAAVAEEEARRHLYRLGRDRYTDGLLLDWARSGAGTDAGQWRRLYGLPERWSPPDFPLRGEDVVALGVTGPAVGVILRTVENEWARDDFRAAREALLCRARALAQGARGEDGP